MRHTAASLAASSGYSLHEVKEMLGHQNIAMTSDLYLHLFKETQQLQAQALGEVIEPICKNPRATPPAPDCANREDLSLSREAVHRSSLSKKEH